MFVDFRRDVKKILTEKKITYANLSKETEIAESTIKSFMSGVNDSRRVAEKIADALGLSIAYSNKNYQIIKSDK